MRIVFIFTLALGLYTLASCYITFPSAKADKLILKAAGKKDASLSVGSSPFAPIIFFVAKFIKIDKYKREKTVRTLARANILMTPEEYQSRAIVISAAIIIGSLFCIVLGIPMVTLIGILLGFVMYFKNMHQADDKIKELNMGIINELPRFIRTYNSASKSDRRLISCIEKYVEIAGPLKYDLNVLLTELYTNADETEALTRFAERVNISYLTDFVGGVIAANAGEDQSTFFAITEQTMNMLAKENLKKEIAKRPSKIKRATIVLTVMLIAVYLYAILINLKTGLGGIF